MGLLTEYFAAPTDEAAASMLNRVGGPASQKVAAEPPALRRRGIFGRRQSAPAKVRVTVHAVFPFDTVDLGGIEPVVQMGTLEEILTGRDYDDIATEDRVIADSDGGEQLIVRLSAELTTALASASDTTLSEAAARWAQTEKFWGAADPSDLAELLQELATLARTAIRTDCQVYCWVCV